jgi:serine protease
MSVSHMPRHASSSILAMAIALGLSSPLALAAGRAGIPTRAPVDANAYSSAAANGDARQDRFIVRYRGGSAEHSDTQLMLRSLQQAVAKAGVAGARGAIQVEHVRRLATGADVVRVSRPLDRVSAASVLRSIAADPAVAYVEPDLMLRHTGLQARAPQVSPALVPDDELFAAYQWHLHNSTGGIRAPAAWEGATGEGVVVAVLDTGITAHDDLDGNVLEGYDFITDTFVSRRGTTARVPGAHDYGDWNDDPAECPVSPSSFHGTHVAGTVAELTNNGIGMAGVAHDAKVLPVRVLGRCGGYLSDIADAIVWASGGSVAGVPDNANPAEAINMSLGGGGACAAQSAMQLAVDAAIANGTTVVVAAGNYAADAANFTPASCANVVTVAATRIGGGKAGYSNYGTRIDLSAPGGGGSVDGNPNGYVWQNINDSATSPELGEQTFGGMSGTSMASPHVAGVVALVQSVAGTPLTPAAMRTLLKDTARSFPTSIPAGTPMSANRRSRPCRSSTVCLSPTCPVPSRTSSCSRSRCPPARRA